MKLTILLVLAICAVALALPGKDEKTDKKQQQEKEPAKKNEESAKPPAKRDEKSENKQKDNNSQKKGEKGDKADSNSKSKDSKDDSSKGQKKSDNKNGANGEKQGNKDGKPPGPPSDNKEGKQENRRGPPAIPGCENYANATDGVKAWDCCPDLPKAFHHGMMFNRSRSDKGKDGKCDKGDKKEGHKHGGKHGEHKHSGEHGRHEHGHGGPENFCEKIDNITAYYNLTGTDGVITVEKAVKYLESATNGSSKYNYKDIVEKCVAQAPADVAAWMEMMKNATGGAGGKGPAECSNSTKLNIAIMHCVRRQLILQCPKWNESTQCTKLMDFAKGCKAYPMMGCHKKRHGDGGRPDGEEGKKGKHGKNEKRQEKKSEEEDETSAGKKVRGAVRSSF